MGTTSRTVECLCDHLTSFGTGLLKHQVTAVQSTHTFAFTTPHQYIPIVFAFIVSTFGIYALMLVWVRKEDLRDDKRVSAFHFFCSTIIFLTLWAVLYTIQLSLLQF